MTRNSDLNLEDLVECDHSPETPIIADNGEITKWLCRCGRDIRELKNENEDERST